ncbi:MAG: archease [Candidatus Woesearchaeota archaeon]
MVFSIKEVREGILLKSSGKTAEEAFADGAKALFSAEVPLKNIASKSEMFIHCSALSVKYLFAEWLNTLLADSEMENMLFSDFEVKGIKKLKKRFFVDAIAKGEFINPVKHAMKKRLKCVSQKKLLHEKSAKTGKHSFQCIVETIKQV